jgi:hypothetical protein
MWNYFDILFAKHADEPNLGQTWPSIQRVCTFKIVNTDITLEITLDTDQNSQASNPQSCVPGWKIDGWLSGYNTKSLTVDHSG